VIYHLVVEEDLPVCCDGQVYRPRSLAVDGFIHCSVESSVTPVANDYFRDAPGRLLLLRIDPSKLSAETRYERAAPPPGADLTHLDSAPAFPHVYGPIELGAVEGVGVLTKTASGYAWPEEFFPIETVLPGP
jgi:uncharacterized protein (DUF952 family)